MKPLLQAKNYSFQYKECDQYALQNINFEIYAKEVILLTGNSGCGKSTLLKAINGLIPHLVEGTITGSLTIDNKEIKDSTMFELSKHIGSVFQNPRSQFFTTNTTSELVFPLENFGYSKQAMQASLDNVCKEFNIDSYLNRNIYTLSSGERQQLALASASVTNPKIYLFDEPSANLDVSYAMKLNQVIKHLKDKGHTIMIADHRFYYLHDIVDRIFLLDQGRIATYEGVTTFQQSPYPTRSFDFLNIPLQSEPTKRTNKIATISHLTYQPILEDLSFDLYENEITVLVGKNGAGKSTLARLLCHTIKPTSGTIQIKDRPFYIAQDADYQLFGSSVLDELALTNNDVSEETLCKTLDAFSLLPLKNRHPFDCSGGEKQRLQIALATLSKAPLLIFDEPTSGLDYDRMQLVCTQIKKLKQHASILIITHDYEFMMEVAQRVLYLENHRIKQDFLLDQSSLQTCKTIFEKMAFETIEMEEKI